MTCSPVRTTSLFEKRLSAWWLFEKRPNGILAPPPPEFVSDGSEMATRRPLNKPLDRCWEGLNFVPI